MSYLTVTSQKFTAVDHSDGDLDWLDGVLFDKYKCVTAFYFQKKSLSNSLTITGSTITNSTSNATESFINDGFLVGEKI